MFAAKDIVDKKVIASLDLEPEKSVEVIWNSLSIIVIFDVLENDFRIQARAGSKVLEDASGWLNNLLAEDKINLNALCKLTDEEIEEQCRAIADRQNAEVEKRVEIIRQKASDNLQTIIMLEFVLFTFSQA